MADCTMRHHGFDIAKAIACIAVVLIHYNFKGLPGACVKVYCTFAVPTFFLISGYFLMPFDGRGLNLSKTVGKITKLVKLLMTATLYYACFTCISEYAKTGFSVFPQEMIVRRYLSAARIVKFFVTNDGLFCPALWFIGALIACYCLILMLVHDERDARRLWFVIIPSWLGMCLVQEFAAVTHFKWNFIKIPGVDEKAFLLLSSFFLFRALPFFLAGTWLRAKRDWILSWRMPNAVLLAIFMASGFVSIGEYFALNHRVAQFYMGSYIGALSLFCWAMRTKSCCRALSYLGCELSMLVYVLHVAVGKTVDSVAGSCHWWGRMWFGSFRWAMVLALSVVAAIVVRKISKMFATWRS